MGFFLPFSHVELRSTCAPSPAGVAFEPQIAGAVCVIRRRRGAATRMHASFSISLTAAAGRPRVAASRLKPEPERANLNSALATIQLLRENLAARRGAPRRARAPALSKTSQPQLRHVAAANGALAHNGGTLFHLTYLASTNTPLRANIAGRAFVRSLPVTSRRKLFSYTGLITNVGYVNAKCGASARERERLRAKSRPKIRVAHRWPSRFTRFDTAPLPVTLNPAPLDFVRSTCFTFVN